MTRWLQSATEHLFIITEAVAWFIVIRVLATTLDHAALTDLRDDIELGFAGPADDPRVVAAAEVLRQGLDGLSSGPSVLIVVFAAYAAVFVSRSVTQLRLPRSGASILGVLASIVLLNVVLHVALAGDLMFWDSGGLADFLDDPSSVGGVREAASFVANPDVDRMRTPAVMAVVVGMFALWGRFLFVGRGSIQFERALRSFSIGFPIVMVAALFSRISGVSALFALPYFVLAMLTLAVANAARTSERDAELTRSAPWAVSALVTMGLLAVVAALFGLIAVLEVERAFTPLGTVLLRFIGWALVIVLTPVFWVLEFVLGKLLSSFDSSILDNAAQNAGPPNLGTEEEREAFQWPGWIVNAFRLGAATAIAVVLYFVGRYFFRRRTDQEREIDYEEERSSAGNTGVGALLRNLIPARRRRPGVPPWLDRHAVYRLFARAVNDAEERGFPRRAGETPLEFAGVASDVLDAPLFPEIAERFDRARYGRHYPDDDDLRPLDRALSEWEQTHPATEESRQTLRRDAPDEPPPPPSRPSPPPGTLPPTGLI